MGEVAATPDTAAADCAGRQRTQQPSREGPALRWLRLRRATYLFKEILGIHDRDDRFLYVTYGGQLDNLGLLELLSRRCKLVVAFDASGDDEISTGTFDGVRKLAFERYGVRFSTVGGKPDPSDDKITANLCTKSQAEALQDLDRRCVVGSVIQLDIHYAPRHEAGEGEKGRLILAKTTLAADTPADILDFCRTPLGRLFPRDSTADQFLEPDQVDNYTALGRHLGQRAVEHASDWFRRAPPDDESGADETLTGDRGAAAFA